MRLGFLGRGVQALRRLFFKSISTIQVHGAPRLMQPLHSVGRGTIRIAKGVTVGYYPSPFFFSSHAYLEARHASASISIGEGTSLNNGFVAIAEHAHIVVGCHCLVGTNVEIYDSDFHGIALADRHTSLPKWAKSVNVGDHVFIGSNVKILKGVTVGDGAVIANGSVVVKDVAPATVVGGNPARFIKQLA